MAVNKVVYGDNTLIDLTSDTVTADTLAEGVTAHDASGEEIVGTMSTSTNGSNADVFTTANSKYIVFDGHFENCECAQGYFYLIGDITTETYDLIVNSSGSAAIILSDGSAFENVEIAEDERIASITYAGAMVPSMILVSPDADFSSAGFPSPGIYVTYIAGLVDVYAVAFTCDELVYNRAIMPSIYVPDMVMDAVKDAAYLRSAVYTVHLVYISSSKECRVCKSDNWNEMYTRDELVAILNQLGKVKFLYSDDVGRDFHVYPYDIYTGESANSSYVTNYASIHMAVTGTSGSVEYYTFYTAEYFA